MIVGHGIDIVSVERIFKMIDEHGRHFLDRCFTPAEQEYCTRSSRRYVEHFAGRFAAKEAVLKVLGTGWRGGIQWTDMEILPNNLGQPILTLNGCARKTADELGINYWHLSISHIDTHATASAIGERR